MAAQVSQAISGIVASKGLTHPSVQKIVRHHCEGGSVVAMMDVVAASMLAGLETEGKLPVGAGVMTPELEAAAYNAAGAAVTAYVQGGGALVPRYVSRTELRELVVTKWRANFRTIPASTLLRAGLPATEISDRLCTSVLYLQHIVPLLVKQGIVEERMTEHGKEYVIRSDNFEPFLKNMAKNSINAFEAPNEAMHQILHGSAK